MDLQECRKQIDSIDNELTRLFSERMKLSAEVAKYKTENNLPVYDPKREREKLSAVAQKAGDGLAAYTDPLYSVIFELSRSYQRKLMHTDSELENKIRFALENTEKAFPVRPIVACQGVEGAYSQIAGEKMFSSPCLMYFSSFEGVFSAIEQGLCRYGILPLENSTAGSVNKIYDLMITHDFNIVRSTRLKVDHCVLANKGVKLSDIKEIITHEQAISQCGEFLKSLGDIKITPCENTAQAASYVFESKRTDIAALSSRSCASIYGLDLLESSVQDKGNNYTRFICISKNLEIYPGADKTSIMMTLPHKPGSLYMALSKFYALGINLIKLESRPLPDSDFEFMFYFDLEASVYEDKFFELFNGIDDFCVTMKYLGSYSEVI